MITTIIIVSIALAWLLYETDFMRVRLETGALQSKSKGIETVLNTTAPIKAEPILCGGCDHAKLCHKDKERWFGYKLPAKTLHLFGHTQTFNAGCNQLRAGMLRDIVKAQTSKTKPTYKPESSGYGAINQDNWLIEVTAKVSLDAKGFMHTIKKLSVNGDYKPGVIRQFVKANK